MKKLLVTGGVLFAVMPAMALDLPSDLIAGDSSINCTSTQDPEFAVAHDSEHPMDMQALYMTNACSAGQYLVVSGEPATFDSDGILENATCTTCPAGSYCEGLSDITITNNQLESSYGMSSCAAGTYSGSGASECTACSAGTYTNQTGQTSCTNAQAGYYTPNTTSEAQCPYGYRDGLAGTGTSIDACSKTVSCTNACNNFNNIVTSGNDACSATVNSNNASIVNGTVAFGSRGTEPLCIVTKTCAAGYAEQNAYAWISEHSDQVSGAYTYCSPNGTGAGCANQDAGTITMTITGNNRPMNELHFATACTTRSIDPQDPSTRIAPANVGFTAQDTGVYCWARSIDFPNQPWFLAGQFEAAQGLTAEESCATYCGYGMASSETYMFRIAENNEPTMFATMLLPALATITASDTNLNVCVASTVNINWGDVEDAGGAETCTYGTNFTAPSAPTPEAGYKFLGWKVTSTTNND